jgi:hypothetical protein
MVFKPLHYDVIETARNKYFPSNGRLEDYGDKVISNLEFKPFKASITCS